MAACSRKSQREKILEKLLRARRERPRGEVSAPELASASLQYNSRLFELRALGFHIVSRVEVVDGQRRGYFRLELGSGSAASTPVTTPTTGEPAEEKTSTLFSEAEMTREYSAEDYPD